MLTARVEETDRIIGLELGADDYVSKPFSVAQLVLRVQAVLRRARVGVEAASRVRLGGEVEIDTRNLAGRRGPHELSFTRREMEVLQYLAANAGRPVPREELLSKVWGYARNLDIETRTVDNYIMKLRQKIEPDPQTPEYIITAHGEGYVLAVEQT